MSLDKEVLREELGDINILTETEDTDKVAFPAKKPSDVSAYITYGFSDI